MRQRARAPSNPLYVSCVAPPTAGALATSNPASALLALGALMALQGCSLMLTLGLRPHISRVVTLCEVVCSCLEIATTAALMGVYMTPAGDKGRLEVSELAVAWFEPRMCSIRHRASLDGSATYRRAVNPSVRPPRRGSTPSALRWRVPASPCSWRLCCGACWASCWQLRAWCLCCSSPSGWSACTCGWLLLWSGSAVPCSGLEPSRAASTSVSGRGN